MSPGRLTDVPGVLVGHHTDPVAATGCTVVLLPAGTIGGCAFVGAAPGSRETDLLRPSNLVVEVHAFVLTGGSAFGLGVADGVVEVLEERGVGFGVGEFRVPIVPTVVLFDLGIGDGKARPGPADGRSAALSADREVDEGSVGAGTGATVAKWRGRTAARKGGIGTASVTFGEVVVGAIVACNAVGDVLDEGGGVLAGARGDAPPVWETLAGQSTVLVAVATNAELDKAQATHVARMASAGVARSVRPAHTFYDGDVVLVGATGRVRAEPTMVGTAAADVVAEALRRGVSAATGLHGIPGLADDG